MTVLTASLRPGAYTDTGSAAPTSPTPPGPGGSYVDTDVFSHLAGGSQRAGSYVDTDVLMRPASGSARSGSYVDTDTASTAMPQA